MAFRVSSHVEQVAAHLREMLLQGRWQDEMPGALKLEQEIGASHTIIDRALRLLEIEGILLAQGPGRKRRIAAKRPQATKLRVRILLYDVCNDDMVRLLNLLHQAGHDVDFAEKTMAQLGMDLKRITRYVRTQEADAWVIIAGSQELLQWFSAQPTPAFALYGRIKDARLASAGPRKLGAAGELLERLIALGHQRIVSIVREERRQPSPSGMEQFFLKTLEQHGIKTGAYHLPDWGDSPDELQRLLDSLFEHTPPTALLIDEPAIMIAAKDHLASRGIIAPKDVSIACYDGDQVLDWCRPAITRIVWDSEKVRRCVVRWANQVAKGNNPRRMTLIDSVLDPGGTIGPPPM